MKKGFILLAIFVFVLACSKQVDQELFDEIESSSFTYYQNGNTLNPQGGSPHGDFKLKFNATAQAALDGNGELPVGSTFQEGSMLIKEVVNLSGEVTLIVAMKKASNNENAALGWLWAEYNPDGSTVISAADKGAACTSCHSSGPNRDFVKTFDFH